MGVSVANYFEQMAALLPPGPAWSVAEGSPIAELFGGLAVEFARIDERATRLLDEADPRTTAELFADWERVAGLPDSCVDALGDAPQTPDQRRATLLGRLTTTGGQSAAYYISVAAAMGYAITITEFRAHTVDSTVDDALCDDGWTHCWQVNAALNSISYATVDSTVEEPLAIWGNAPLECAIKRISPAHTTVFFSYI